MESLQFLLGMQSQKVWHCLSHLSPQHTRNYHAIDELCFVTTGNRCKIHRPCEKSQGYASKRDSFDGVPATDGFTFTTSDDGTMLVPRVLFECATAGQDVPNIDNSEANGIFGLGYHKESLVQNVMAELWVRELFDLYDVEKLRFRGHLDKDLQGFPELIRNLISSDPSKNCAGRVRLCNQDEAYSSTADRIVSGTKHSSKGSL
ncbi:hypothetical protein TIFTF001_030709 [Ficus carica]|uniref:Xylanase inhibitor N-terminal domain-containing protein n=1 Tax=Ficus carica TaxID=3494 RepID=A0AA88DUW6_FICCA|nr:hypothetical protein TIFTF001_030709 [Ficus carica]